MRSTVEPSLITSASRENNVISCGANANRRAPHTVISPVSSGIIARSKSRSFFPSFAPSALPASVAAAVCIPHPGI